MRVGELKKKLEKIPDNCEIFIAQTFTDSPYSNLSVAEVRKIDNAVNVFVLSDELPDELLEMLEENGLKY